jgi:hypothetical protein
MKHLKYLDPITVINWEGKVDQSHRLGTMLDLQKEWRITIQRESHIDAYMVETKEDESRLSEIITL